MDGTIDVNMRMTFHCDTPWRKGKDNHDIDRKMNNKK